MLFRFARQADDEMRAHLQAAFAGSKHRSFVFSKTMSAVDAPE